MRLNLIHPDTSAARVEVEFKLSSGCLRADFEVQGSPIFANSSLAGDGSQWGLWDWDVVELFLSAGGPYYEFQVSPLGQYFELQIFEPRKKFNRDYKSGFRHEAARLSEDHWKASLEIELASIGASPEKLVGNAFAILGSGKPRSHFSLFLPRQEKPDFHLPRYFRKLI